MSIPKNFRRQVDFSAGQLNRTAERRVDQKIFDAGLLKAENMRSPPTGGLKRRSGRRVVYFDAGQHDLIRPVSGATFDITFAVGRFTARLQNGGIVANITGCPWDAATLANISWTPVGRRIYVAARGMRPQYIEYDPDAGTWTRFDYDFQTLAAGRRFEPFHRFADLGITLKPSATTGNITLVASAAIFVAQHVGVRFTWMKRQMQITAVTDTKHASATVIEELPPTYRVTLDSVDGYIVGETLEGDQTSTSGEIVGIDVPGKKLDIVVFDNFTGFEVDEYLVAANSRGKVVSQAVISPGPSLQWKEAFMSALRGYPGSVAYELQRLIFCDWPQFEHAILASGIGAEQDFDTAASAADAAIFTYVPKPCRVYQVLAGTGDVFVISDAGTFYLEVSPSNPFTNGNSGFKPIDAKAAANVHAVFAEAAVLFVGADNKAILAIVSTGAANNPYQVTSLSESHSDLFNNPLSIAVADGSAAAPGRMLYVVNSDGTVVAGSYADGADFVGWFPWTSTGMVTAACAKFGAVLFSVSYDGTETVEAVDDSVYLDGAIPLADFVGSDAIQTSTGEAITTSTSLPLVTNAGALVPFAGVTMVGWGDGFFLGPITVDGQGHVEFPPGYADRLLGWTFTPDVQPFVPTFEGGEDYGQAQRRRKIGRVLITVRDTVTFVADGRSFAGYKVGENQEEPRPLRNETYRYRPLGRKFDPRVEITQPTPGPLHIIELSVQVTI